MSTKMYNLYRYTPNDLHQLYEWLPVLRKWYIAHLVDELVPLKVPSNKLWETLYDATSEGYRGLFNIEASCVVYCDQGQVYIQFFGIPSELYEYDEVFIDCSYQNQSDRPDDVTEEEWETRRALVDRLLDRDYGARPGHAGLSYILADVSDCAYIAERVRKVTSSPK